MTRVIWPALILMLASCGCSSQTMPSPTTTAAPSTSPPAPIITPTLPTRDPARFDQHFWDEFIHNGFDAPPGAEPLRRLLAAPTIYLKTVDEAGVPMDALTLQTVEDAMRAVAATWGGGQFGLRGIERGTGTKAGVSGYLTVIWPNPPAVGYCGLSNVGLDGGVMQFNYLRPEGCGCNGSRIRPRTVYHELGHAFGYWHTDNDADAMRAGINGCADVRPSTREIYHAQLAYQTPVGTTARLRALRDATPITIID